MSKIRVIDLLNKIANGEEVPKKIKCQDCIWKYEESFKQYKNENFRELVKALLGYYQKEAVSFTLYGALTCEVEIIEEEPEIDIQGIDELEKDFTYYEDHSAGITVEKVLSAAELELANKLNELIKAVKQLDKRINNK